MVSYISQLKSILINMYNYMNILIYILHKLSKITKIGWIQENEFPPLRYDILAKFSSFNNFKYHLSLIFKLKQYDVML